MSQKHLPDTLAAIAGVAFAVLLFLGLATVDPLREATDAELTAWWSDGSNLRDTYLAMYFMLASLPCLLVFVGALRARLAAAEGGSAPVASIVLAVAVCYAAAIALGYASRGLIAHSVRFGGEPLPGPDTLRTLTTFSILSMGMVAVPAAAMMIGAASWIILRTRVLSVWLGYAGLVVVALAAVAVAAQVGPFASPLIQLWVIGASFLLWRTREARSEVPQREPVTMATTGTAALS